MICKYKLSKVLLHIDRIFWPSADTKHQARIMLCIIGLCYNVRNTVPELCT